MSNLGRINLLVGRNNSGKTSILEALHLLESGAELAALWRILLRRGEQPIIEQVPGRPLQQEVDISHLFEGHEILVGSRISISTTNKSPDRQISYVIEEVSAKDNPVLFAQLGNEEPSGTPLGLRIHIPGANIQPIPLASGTAIRQNIYQLASNLVRAQNLNPRPVQYIANESLSMAEMLQLWNSIVLTPEEDRVVQALQAIDPDIERLAAVGGVNFFAGQRAGFAVRVRGSEKRIPIGSFGDGVWRIVALAAAISRAKDGLLLIDEIDTGLHHSVMEAMWRMIENASSAFNVQVFATTHSYDCVHSLASLCNNPNNSDCSVSIQRIEPNRDKAIAFTDAQIQMIAERDIEVR